jgi:hypothetical protein
VIKLAGRGGAFDLSEEYGVPAELIEALDITTQLAMAAGLDALREAGIPLVQTYRTTHRAPICPTAGCCPRPARRDRRYLRQRLPRRRPLRRRVQAATTPGEPQAAVGTLEDCATTPSDAGTLNEIGRRIAELRDELERNPYEFDRRFIFRILAMGHSQFAEYIGARGPNTHVNAACASTAQAIAVAEDWIRSGRCRRVIVVGADDVTSENLMGWVGAGFLAQAPPPPMTRWKRRRCPLTAAATARLLGMGACALVVESEDAVRERGMRGIVEVLSSETANSAFHGTRLDVNHISDVMNRLVTAPSGALASTAIAMAPQTGLHLARDLHPGPRRQRGGRGHSAAQHLRRCGQRDRRLQHQGLHRPPDGRRRRRCDRRQDSGIRHRAAGAQLQGG